MPQSQAACNVRCPLVNSCLGSGPQHLQLAQFQTRRSKLIRVKCLQIASATDNDSISGPLLSVSCCYLPVDHTRNLSIEATLDLVQLDSAVLNAGHSGSVRGNYSDNDGDS